MTPATTAPGPITRFNRRYPRANGVLRRLRGNERRNVELVRSGAAAEPLRGWMDDWYRRRFGEPVETPEHLARERAAMRGEQAELFGMEAG